ncbi:protein FAR1-RELATED SEQUENCE 4-like [Rutidosis leptorrhynchoides]|uniref:protein FAR1-RELATED SEQUENCE 4-like n=1 Tax=Rutidosis leptorrhynchoides TaxID=125765 RepID=UPI003A99018D
MDLKAEPQEHIEFDSNESAYEYYKEYAKSVGFGTAKLSSRRSRASKEFIDAKFSCIRYGNKQQSDDAINPRPSPKIGCKASMHVKRKPNGKWYIHSFVKDHNHELLPSQSHFFRSHRNSEHNDSKLRKKTILSSMSKRHGEYQCSGLETYIRDQNDRGRRLILEEGDAQILLELLVTLQEENPKNFYSVDLNEENQLRNVFWVDAKGIDDYKNFCDVVSLDTTYFTNKYKIPLVLFIGVNQHCQPTLLGCALIADETVATFAWLFHTWYLAMGKRAPNVIVSDQSNSIEAALISVLPRTRHCYGLWNVLENVSRQLDYLNPWHDTFMAKFNKCIYKSCTEEEFDKRWMKLVNKFNLGEVAWFQSLYQDRKLWAPTFMKNVSLAGLSEPFRSESVNSFFDKYIQVDTCFRDLVERYKTIIEDMYEEEAKADFDAWHDPPELKSPSPFEKQLSFVYTHEIFKKFQDEVLGAVACHLKVEKEDEVSITYIVKDVETGQDYMVEWNGIQLDICCSCRSFELKGYLCRHAIVVLQMSGVFSIPIKYVLQRWTNAALSRCPIGEKLENVQTRTRRLNDLCRRAVILGEEGSISQESYKVALDAIQGALLQCSKVNKSNEDESRPSTSTCNGVFGNEEEDVNRGVKRVETGKEKSNGNGIAVLKEKVLVQQPEVVNIGIDASFHQMDLPNTRLLQLHNIMPPQLHGVVPTMFHNVASTQFHNVGATQMQNNRLPN